MMCTHDWLEPGHPLGFELVLDDWLGPTLGLIQCSRCRSSAIAYLIAWQGKKLEDRVFAIRELSAAAAQTYQHNVTRDYCDLSRKQSETQALLSSASVDTDLVRTGPPAQCTVASSRSNHPLPCFRWQEIDPGGCDELVPVSP